jgi:integrase
MTDTDASNLMPLQPTTLTPFTPSAGDERPAVVYLARLAPGSRRTMRAALQTIVTLVLEGKPDIVAFPWHLLRYQHTQAIRSALAERYAPATANKLLAALRGVLQEAWRLGLIPAEDYHRAVDLTGIRATTLPRGRALSRGEVGALLASCTADRSPGGARDAALVALLYGAGLRRAEAVALDLRDYELTSGMLTVRAGKGRKDRLTYLTPGAAEALRDWLALRGDAPGPLLCPVNKGGRIILRRMTAQAAMAALAKRAKQAGVAHLSPHDLRRTFISHLLDAGADIATVQQLAGHANVQTTTRYDRRGEAAKRRAADLLHVPYDGRRW